MIFVIDYETFKTRFIVTSRTVYAHETESSYDFYVSDDIHTIKTSVEKPHNVEQQLLLKERILGTAESNIIGVIEVIGDDKPEVLELPNDDYDTNEPQGSTMGDQTADDL